MSASNQFYKDIQNISGYVVVEEIYSKATTKIYKVRDNAHYRVLKIIDQSSTPSRLRRFEREVQFLNAFSNTNGIPKILTCGKIHRNPYYVMEYLEGSLLSQYINKNQRFSEQEAIKIIEDIALIVKQIHEKQTLHCGLSPINVFLAKKHIYLLGCGYFIHHSELKSLQLSEVGNSLHYTSPEQANGDAKKMGPWSDIYSLGAILYHLLTGCAPFDATNDIEVIHNLATNNLRPINNYDISISAKCQLIINRTLNQDIASRYQSIDELLANIAHIHQTSYSDNGKLSLGALPKQHNATPEKEFPKRRIEPKIKTSRYKNNTTTHSRNYTHLLFSFSVGIVITFICVYPFLSSFNTQQKIPKKVELTTDKNQNDSNKSTINTRKNPEISSELSNQFKKVSNISSVYNAKWIQKNGVWIGTVATSFGLMRISDFPQWKNYEFKADILVKQGRLGIFVRNFVSSAQFPYFLGQMRVFPHRNLWYSVTATAQNNKILIQIDNTTHRLTRVSAPAANPGIVGFGLASEKRGIPALAYVKNLRIKKLP